MKTLCITGSVQSRLDPFAENLGKAGASAARPTTRDQEMTIAAWHRKVLATQKDHASVPSTSAPGHVWEQLVGEIFLANHNQPLWCWADTGSTLLLDFWFNFDPNTFFLLLHTSPHEALMDAIEHGADTLEVLQNALDDWYQRTRQMLRFHLRHPTRSILLDSNDVLGQPDAYIDVLAQRWQLPLETIEIEQTWQNDPHHLTFYLVDKFLQNQPQALALHHEVQASLFLISNSEAPASKPELGDVVSDYLEARRLFQAGQADNDTLRQTLKAAQSQLADSNLALQDRQVQLANLKTDHRHLQSKSDQYQQELSETRSDLENSDQENRLLLDQLRHTRESLEKLILEEQRKTQQLANLETGRKQLQEEVEQYRQELSETQGNLERSEQESQLLLDQLHQTQEALEKLILEEQRKTQQLANLETDRKQLQKEVEQYRQELSETQGNLERSEQESQLLLDQLHQTQEALEKLILEEQRKTQQLVTLETDRKQLQKEVEQYRQELSETQGSLETSEQESQLLLDQLHQTQEALEKLILDEQRKTQQLADLSAEKNLLLGRLDTVSKEKAALATARDEQTKLANERKAQIDALAKEKTDLLATRDALAKEKTALTAARDEQIKLASERKAQVDALAKEKTDLLASRDALAKEKTALTAARDEQTKLTNERKAQIDALAKEKADLLAGRDALAKEKTALTAARDEQTKLANERKAQVDALAKEKTDLLAGRDALAEEKTALTAARDEQTKLASERKAQVDALAKEKTDLLAGRDALAKEKTALTAARDEQTKLANERKAQIDALAKEKADLLAGRDTLAKEKTALTAARDEQTKLANERKAQVDALAKEKTDLLAGRDALAKEKTALTAARDEQTKLANERKAQVDTLAKEKTDLLATRDALAKEKTALTAARDEQTRLANELKAEIDILTKNHEQQYGQVSRAVDESDNENQQLLIQLHQTQEELEHSLLAAHDEKTRLANELKAEIDTLTKNHEQQYAQARQVLDESDNENQQLLIQLHQTQEELERSLLRCQASQAQLGEQQARLQKILKHHPDYWDFDTLEINLLESDGNQQVAQWRLTELYIGGRLIPEIRFKTCLANGLAGIVIQRTEGTDSPAPLLRWPNGFATAEELPCIPTRGPSTQGSNAALSGLSTSDWDTLQRLARQLAGLLTQPTDSRLPKQLNAAALRNGLLALTKTLANWPKMLRYDSIRLQETLRNQGYERLGITLSNLRLGHHHWPALDYRLATVDIKPHPFGQNPRLEFPDGSARGVLQNWFAESDDSRGPRLELRFAQPNAMDTRVWSMLSPNDQQLIGALIKTLPLQLEELQQANPAASRPWQDWQALAGMLRDTLRDILIRSTAPRRTPAGIEE